ncbi:histidine phosphatase family protein [Nocardia inohanensis]|uniref:histidine phosphatase family protein n=1 Tax=Nocardia inohanensis TaxID=209246 RepID=UPI00082AA044|nr:histidine phosphatase family protein [Nocardia inohanensis]
MALESLTMVRHGESTGNARKAADEAAGLERFDESGRDADTPLSELGRAQARAVGTELCAGDRRFDTVLSSPFVRARTTAELALKSLPIQCIRVDERLRDRDTGVLFGYTELGIRRHFPLEHRERERKSRFYYRPPGGESFTDVALRLRTLLRELDGHVLIFTHDVVVVMARYILGDLDEATILDIERNQIGNASISRWERVESGLELVTYGDVTHLT